MPLQLVDQSAALVQPSEFDDNETTKFDAITSISMKENSAIQ